MTPRLLILADALVREIRYAARPETASTPAQAIRARRSSVRLAREAFREYTTALYNAETRRLAAQSAQNVHRSDRRDGLRQHDAYRWDATTVFGRNWTGD